MTKRQRQTLNQYSKNSNDYKYIRDEWSKWLTPGLRKFFRRRANKSQRRHNRAICKDFSYVWQRLPGCASALRISQ